MQAADLLANANRLLHEEQMRAQAGLAPARQPFVAPRDPGPFLVPDPDPPRAAAPMRPLLSEGDLLILRSRLPNLAGISDQFLQTTSLADLTALNGLNPVAQAAPFAPSPSDHSRIMSASLAALTATPTMLPAGVDDRLQNLHPARFLAGPACDAGQLWLAAKAAIGPAGLIPIASYDMEKIGLSGCVTARGWFELHDPASTSLSLKLFSSANVGNSTSSNKRLTLADTDGVINVGDSMQEIADMADFQTALRAVSKAASFAIPWNHSFNAIEGFLHASNFCAAELANRPNRAALLTAFVNHVFGINAKSGPPGWFSWELTTSGHAGSPSLAPGQRPSSPPPDPVRATVPDPVPEMAPDPVPEKVPDPANSRSGSSAGRSSRTLYAAATMPAFARTRKSPAA